jgi:hypothetical protein
MPAKKAATASKGNEIALCADELRAAKRAKDAATARLEAAKRAAEEALIEQAIAQREMERIKKKLQQVAVGE